MSVEEGCCCLYSTYIIPSPMCGIIWGVNCCLFWSYVARSALNNDSDEGKRRREDCGHCCDENYFNSCCLCTYYSVHPTPHSCCCSQSLKVHYPFLETNKKTITRTPLKSCWNKMTCYMCGTPYKVSDPQKYKKLIEKYKKLKEKYKYDNEINIHLYDDDDDKNDNENDNENDNILALTKI